ncbi:MAG: HAMP domain-containing protein [Spirochaetales bacterium]|nr:HAMP domain-containing protein [Spirochaetales bacterium]
MKIRSKIILITLPLIIAPVLLTMMVGILSARNGITLVAREFLSFKSMVLNNYMESQWTLLKENHLDTNALYVDLTKTSIGNFAATLTEGKESEKIFAIDRSAEIPFSTKEMALSEEDRDVLRAMVRDEITGWRELRIGETDLISEISFFEPFGWYVFVSVERQAFYGSIVLILYRTGLIFILSVIAAFILLVLFSSYLTRPLENVVQVIKSIIETNDLSARVTLRYRDETGRLGHYFNIMTGELDKAYEQMKKYAFQAVMSRHKERKIRNIFQKYVPKDVIDKFFSNPEGMLVGENRVLAVLFTDIRRFTSISEGMKPDELVESLNRYFGQMVEVISNHGGIVDKYIGDAIMAFFGAPVTHDDDALQSLRSALEMLERLKEFNLWQKAKGREPFEIGIGINYGEVTIGNIGSEKKMDYTVIGDMVNLASRLEGLTKVYREPLLISHPLYERVAGQVPCRLIDKVVVKGKTLEVNIYAARSRPGDREREAWDLHHKALELYYSRDFKGAQVLFEKVREILPDDVSSRLFIQRCSGYQLAPPEEDWTGAVEYDMK